MSEPRLLITRLYLQSIKSYREADIALPAGTIAICGTNGAGKSTLIEAIGFALFGSQRVRQEQLIREGEAHGRIEIGFVSGLDGLSYAVTRELRRSGAATARLYSDAHGFNVAEGVRDVQAETAQHLGIRSGMSLDTLFDGVIGVPQGQLTGDFLLTPAPRRTRFEELLALQEFNVAYQRLSGPRAFGRDRLATARGRLAALADRVAAAQGVRGELLELQARLGERQRQSVALQRQLAEATSHRERLDAAEARLQTARRRLSEAGLARRLAEQREQEAKRRWQEADAAGTEAAETRDGHDRYLELDASARELETARRKRDVTARELSEVVAGLAGLQSTTESLEQRLAVAADARREAERLRPEAEQQAALELALSEARDRLTLRSELESQLAARTKAGTSLAERLEQLAVGAAGIDAAERAIQETEAHLEETRSESSGLTAALEAETAEIEARRQAEEAVRRGETSACPVCRRPFVEGDAEGFLQHLREEMAEHQRTFEGMRRRDRELRSLLSQRRQAVEEAQRALLQARADAAALDTGRSQQAEANRALESLRTRLSELEGVQAEAVALTSRLKALGDPRGLLRVAESGAAQHDRLAAELATVRSRMEAAGSRREALEAQVRPFAELDRQLAEAVEARDECRAAFDAHRRFAPLAAEIEDRLAELEKRRIATREHLADLVAAQDELAAAEEAHDKARHAEARRREHELDLELTRVQADLDETDRRLGEAGARLAELERLEEEQQRLSQSSARDQRGTELLAFLRDTIRGAGPEIARLVLARVSQAATVTYSELMADHASTLVWGNDYGITVERAGQIRDFIQLSGGEQVAAALAVRLALLREVSELRIAFFDEPTINLDEHRRRGLADQMRSIRDLDQLFVISHDDSLESVTDNVIRVRKEDGQSLVEPA